MFQLVEGIYLVHALRRVRGKQIGHFVVYDGWRGLLIVEPGREVVVRVELEAKVDEQRVGAFLFERFSLLSPLT